MSMLSRVTSMVSTRPPIIMLYASHGIGKTTLGASTPNPIFIQTEDGLGLLTASTFGLLKTFDEVMQAIGELYSEPHDYKTVVIDSLDWLERLVWAQTCKDNGWKSIEDANYGKGYAAAVDLWYVLIEGLNALRNERGMTIVMLAHSMIVKYAAPDADPYDKFAPKLHKAASALVQEAADCVFFASYRISTIKTDAGFNKVITRAVGGGERVIYTEERPAFAAKQRYAMPPSIPMTWDAIAQHIPSLQIPATAAVAA